MTKSPEQDHDEPLNLDALSFDELGRSIVRDGETDVPTDMLPPLLPTPHVSVRCHSAERELLGNHFPTE